MVDQPTDLEIVKPVEEFEDPDITVIESRIQSYEKIATVATETRDSLIQPIITTMKHISLVSPEGVVVADNLKAYCDATKVVDTVLRSKERSAFDVTVLRMKQNESSMQGDVSDKLTELLKIIDPKTPPIHYATEDDFTAATLKVKDATQDITIKPTELRTDNNDLT